jgi:hypothetical protein
LGGEGKRRTFATGHSQEKEERREARVSEGVFYKVRRKSSSALQKG